MAGEIGQPRCCGSLRAMLRSPSLFQKQQATFEKYFIGECHDEIASVPNQLFGSKKKKKKEGGEVENFTRLCWRRGIAIANIFC